MREIPAGQNTALVFDWGDTLMKVYPQYNGAMADWPEVGQVDGVIEALEGLLGRHVMVVATNAAESDATDVWRALKRVGLEAFFRAVFTTRELDGARKPELRFFRQLENVLSRPVHQLVMVGDSYTGDILGAKGAGWRAVWYNPGHQLPPGSVPLHDAELFDMRSLPALLRRAWLPDVPTCLAWLEGRGAPYNLLTHVQLVASTAYLLAAWLAQAGESVDPILTHRGGLLHDLAKMDSIRLKKERGEHGDHAAMARDVLLERGQPELAEIADRHMVYADPHAPRRPVTWEQRLVNFADKLAEGSQIVPIEDRLAALKQRYPAFAGEMEQSTPVLQALQQEICDRLGLTPAELVEKLRQTLGLQMLP